MKTCPYCEKEKPETAFEKNRAKCKACRSVDKRYAYVRKPGALGSIEADYYWLSNRSDANWDLYVDFMVERYGHDRAWEMIKSRKYWRPRDVEINRYTGKPLEEKSNDKI